MSGHALQDPTQPDKHQHNIKNQSAKVPSLKLKMIMMKQQVRYALINNTLVKQGDHIQGAKVLQILDAKVILTHQGQSFDLLILENQGKISISR